MIKEHATEMVLIEGGDCVIVAVAETDVCSVMDHCSVY